MVAGRAAMIGTAAADAISVTEEGIAQIESHLQSLGALEDGPNAAMVARLRAGERTVQDLNFYQHETIESQIMSGGVTDARAAHLETLRRQGIPYEAGYEAQLYHPDVIRAHADQFNPAAHPPPVEPTR
jgi:hypothetical protein